MTASHPEFERQLRTHFALLRAMVRRSSEGREEAVEQYAAQLEARIGALARVNEMLMRDPVATGVDLQDLLRGELLALATPISRYCVAGPDVRLSTFSATPVALTLHELAMNALLHGALGISGGYLSVTWQCVEQDGVSGLLLEWIERGVPIDTNESPHKGFGSEIIERTLPYELGARTALRLTAQGIEAAIWIPAGSPRLLWRLDAEEEFKSRGHHI